MANLEPKGNLKFLCTFKVVFPDKLGMCKKLGDPYLMLRPL